MHFNSFLVSFRICNYFLPRQHTLIALKNCCLKYCSANEKTTSERNGEKRKQNECREEIDRKIVSKKTFINVNVTNRCVRRTFVDLAACSRERMRNARRNNGPRKVCSQESRCDARRVAKQQTAKREKNTFDFFLAKKFG